MNVRSLSVWALIVGLAGARAQAQDVTAPETPRLEEVRERDGAEDESAVLRALQARLDLVESEVGALRAELAEERAEDAAVAPVIASVEATEEAAGNDGGMGAPLAYADFTWVPGNYGALRPALHFEDGELVIDGEIRVDAAYHYSFANPVDGTISGSSEVFRHGELQLTQVGLGGSIAYGPVHVRLMTQFGAYSQGTPRNDASVVRGQWNLDDAYRYISEAYGGVHIDTDPSTGLNGINVEAGIFMSYIGLWSYYNFDNWTYQPSYVSSNTPWYFVGVRAQIFVGDTLKIEPWLVNGWQAYGRFNDAPGFGGQILWRPEAWFSMVSNNYAGTDTLGQPDRWRFHTDDSVMVRTHDDPDAVVSRSATSLTIDAGCEWGGTGTDASGNTVGIACDEQFFLGFMLYERLWFEHHHFALTVGGGAITNPGRYLVLVPPINGATAFSGAAPHYTANARDGFEAWDLQVAADWMPFAQFTLRVEYNHRAASIPYFSGRGGVTPPGGNQGAPGSVVMGWAPDLAFTEDRLTVAIMTRL